MTAMLKAHVQEDQSGQTLVLTISNPEMRNALGPEIYAAGIEAFNAAESNPDIRSIILTGEGDNFCAGGNLHRLLANREKPPQVQQQSIESLHDFIECIHTYPKPVIAAVEGVAAGAGFSLALACDFLVAASHALFVMSYSRVGLSPDGGGSWNLSQKLPKPLALEWLMLGERQSAQRLHELGLVNRITPVGQALPHALTLATQLHAQAPNVLAAIKDLVQNATNHDIHTQLDLERDYFVKNLHHVNGKEGIDAFLAKRPPHYKP